MTEPLLSFEQMRQKARDLARKRREAREEYEHHAGEASEAERKFRKELAVRFAVYRKEDKGSGEAEILAQGDAAEHRAKRDMENALAKSALLRIDELERDQATLRQLGSWSQELETTGVGG